MLKLQNVPRSTVDLGDKRPISEILLARTTWGTTASSSRSFGTSTLFRALGAKLVETVGGGSLPLKDVATSDALLLREPPAADDEVIDM